MLLAVGRSRRNAWRACRAGFALFFVTFALAEVSVLQAYCASETLGIEAIERLAADRPEPRPNSDGAVIIDPVPDTDPKSPCENDGGCFGSCSHVTIPLSASANFESFREFPQRRPDGGYHVRHSEAVLVLPFHPPKLA